VRSSQSGTPLRSLLVAVVVAATLLSAMPATAAPTNAEIERKRAEAASAQAKLDTMAEELDIQVEEYNAISEALEKTREDIRSTRAELVIAARELGDANRQLAGRATSIYKGGSQSLLDVLLGTSSFEDFITRFDLLMRINRSDAQMVAQVKAAKAQVESIELSLVTREAEQVSLRSETERRAERIETAIKEQATFVASLNAEVRTLIKEEEDRQRKLAEERARLAAALAAKSGGRPPVPEGDLPAGHPEVVAIALKYLGVPYKWGGASPSGFDCSGLCQYAYEQIGIVLPRTSRSQYNAGAHIAADRLDLLQPGDLVFFGRNGDPGRIHHVGMYVGNGNYLHAPSTGDVVKVSSLTERIASRGDYVGASRF
jgi:cell wall-associated NlpC family hydrolase